MIKTKKIFKKAILWIVIFLLFISSVPIQSYAEDKPITISQFNYTQEYDNSGKLKGSKLYIIGNNLKGIDTIKVKGQTEDIRTLNQMGANIIDPGNSTMTIESNPETFIDLDFLPNGGTQIFIEV